MPERTTQPAATEPQPAPAPQAPRSARLGRGASLALLLIGLVAVGSIAFAAGRLTGPGSSATGSPTCPAYAYGRGGNAVCMDEDDMGHMGQWMPGGMHGGMYGGMPGGGGMYGGMPGGGGMYGGMYGYNTVVTGTVQAIDSSSITLQLSGGRTVQIALSSNTVYRTAGSPSPATAADVKVGATVTVGLTGGQTLTAAQVIIRNP